MGRKDDSRAFRHLIELLDENRSAILQGVYDVLVVHNLLAYVNRWTVKIERLLHGDYRAVDTGAIASRSRQKPLPRVGPAQVGRDMGCACELLRHGLYRTCAQRPAGLPRSLRPWRSRPRPRNRLRSG